MGVPCYNDVWSRKASCRDPSVVPNINSKRGQLNGFFSVEVANSTSGRKILNCVIQNCDDDDDEGD